MIPSFENMEALKADMEKNPDIYVEGTTVYLEDIKEGVRYINGEWVADETMETKANGDITMSLYEMNRQLINQLPDYNEEAWGGAEEILKEYLEKHPNSYYMMYGRELNYFTVFHKENGAEFTNLFGAVKACLDSVGGVRSFDFDGEAAIEIWVKPEVASTVTCLYLFPYDDGVVTFGE
jgi:hypothetical protein